ncbi:MAG: TonB-dependent receptor [Opitutae bacterium]|nr:TonB-dependent receptor [Opitutae bacterium]
MALGFLLFAYLSSCLSAQIVATGEITGRVSNKATGDLLRSAFVSVEGTKYSTSTETDGTFTIQAPEGMQKVTVSYTGLDSVTVTVNVTAGKRVVQDIAMSSEVYTLEAFTVKGVREGNALALQVQRDAPNSKTVAATDTFGTPAANPGELLQRMPNITAEIVGSEVRTLFIRGMGTAFSTMQVDGNQMASAFGTSANRDYQIEQMGTGSIDSIELIKAPLPEHDANAVAGFVNLQSKRAYDASGRKITLNAGLLGKLRESSANPIQGKPSGLDSVSLAYSDVVSVFGGERNLGFSFNAARRRSFTVQDEIGNSQVGANTGYFHAPGSHDGTTGMIRQWGTGDFYYPAIATNVGFNVDYKLGNGSYWYVRTNYNSNTQNQRFYRWNIQTGASAASFSAASTPMFVDVVPTAAASSNAQSNSSTFVKKSYNYSINPGASFKLFKNTAKLDVSAFFSHADVWYPGYDTVYADTKLVAPTGLGWSLDFRGDKRYPIFRQTAGASLTSPATYTPYLREKWTWSSPDNMRNFKFDFRKDLDAAVPVYVKVGAKLQIDSRAQYRDYGADNVWTGPTGITPYVETSYLQGGGRYGPWPFIVPPGVSDKGNIAQSGFFSGSATQPWSNFVNSNNADGSFREQITAAYAEGKMELGKLSVLGGLRVEETDVRGTMLLIDGSAQYNSNATLTAAENLALAKAKFKGVLSRTGNYRNVFPGVHFTYTAQKNLLFRLSYNSSISRPPIANILQIINVSPTSSTVSMGNPDLKPYRSDNFEFSVERYFEPVGEIRIGAFYKNIKDYIASNTSTIGAGQDNGFDGQYANWTLSTPRNIGSAWVRGFDVSYQQQFSNWLPGFWKGFGVQGNFTTLTSEGNYGGATTLKTLAGLVPHSGNASLNYQRYGLNVRLLASYRGPHVKVLGTNGNTSYWAARRTMYDLKTRYTISRNYDIFLDVFNLNNTPTQEAVVGGQVFSAFYQGVTYNLGITGRF